MQSALAGNRSLEVHTHSLIHIVKVDRTLLTVNLARELAAHGIDLEVIVSMQGPLRCRAMGDTASDIGGGDLRKSDEARRARSMLVQAANAICFTEPQSKVTGKKCSQ